MAPFMESQFPVTRARSDLPSHPSWPFIRAFQPCSRPSDPSGLAMEYQQDWFPQGFLRYKFFGFFTAANKCPLTHPFPFNNGAMCNKIGSQVHVHTMPSCDHSELKWDSLPSCAYNGNIVQCSTSPGEVCNTNKEAGN